MFIKRHTRRKTALHAPRATRKTVAGNRSITVTKRTEFTRGLHGMKQMKEQGFDRISGNKLFSSKSKHRASAFKTVHLAHINYTHQKHKSLHIQSFVL